MVFLTKLIKGIIKLCKITLLSLLVPLFLVLFLDNPNLRAETINAFVEEACNKYGVSEQLVLNVIEAESSFDVNAVSHCDARGLMQITRPTWDWITQYYLEVDWDYDLYCFDSEKNIIVGTRFLKWISDYLDKKQLNAPKQDLVLACYNAGPGNVEKYNYTVPPFAETQNYVAKINKMSKS
jgi:soluble lytic murein transglycosylase-like protein